MSTTEASITIPSYFTGETEYAYPSRLHAIHVKSVLSDEEAARCLALATDHAETTGAWAQPDTVRHAAYSTCDFAVEECEALQGYLELLGFDGRIWEHLSSLYGVDHKDLTYLDFFCAHYQAHGDSEDESTKTMDRLEAHRDGSLLSFTITLSDPDEFEGGGTFFDALPDVEPSTPVFCKGGVVRPLRAGDGVLHSGKLLHGADVVRSGKRTVLVGFVEVSDLLQRRGALSAACRDWGRMDVAAFRWKRQQKMTNGGQRKGWPLNYARWIPRGPSESFARGICPAFESVERRANPSIQRRKKLEAEDLLLRSIMLPERTEAGFAFEGDEITILE